MSTGQSVGLLSDVNRLIDFKLGNKVDQNTKIIDQNVSKLNGLGKLTKKISIYGEWIVYIQGIEGEPTTLYRYIRFIDNGTYEKVALMVVSKPQDFPIVAANINPETGQINHLKVLMALVQDGMIIAQQNPEDGIYYQNSFENNSNIIVDFSALQGFSLTVSFASLELRFLNNNENFTEVGYATKLFNNTSQSFIHVGDLDYQFLVSCGLEIKPYEDTVLFDGDKRYTVNLQTLV